MWGTCQGQKVCSGGGGGGGGGGGCSADCAGKSCGSDGCGGSCGTCSGSDTVLQDNVSQVVFG